jgi:hypothetical protein
MDDQQGVERILEHLTVLRSLSKRQRQVVFNITVAFAQERSAQTAGEKKQRKRLSNRQRRLCLVVDNDRGA